MVLSVHDAEQRFANCRMEVLSSPSLFSSILRRYNAARLRGDLAQNIGALMMDPITIQQSDDILNLLADVSLLGKGFTTDCLLDYVLDQGFTEPIYLNASGEDPDALYKGQPNAWAIYQVREWKRVLTVSGGPGKERRVQITETP